MNDVILSPITLSELSKTIEDIVKRSIAENGKTENDELITSAEVMRLCRISHVTLQKWRNTNKIPSKKIGGKILYPKAQVLKIVTSSGAIG